ncbi:MAG: stage V sporulation protein T, partial [Clostridia bacterium]|nr:stage V sporulation protein T [Clostridia bacterium]
TARRPLTKNAVNGDRMLPVTRGDDARSYTQQLIVPIVASGDPIGAVILLSREPGAAFSMADIKVAETAASFLGRQLEN